MRRAAECPHVSGDGRVNLNFDNVSVDAGKNGLELNSQIFAESDQGLHFGGGFERVVYSSRDSFIPSSLPALLRFDQMPGKTAKIEAADGCSRFNLVSWNLGCDPVGTLCRFNITGFHRIGNTDVVTVTKLLELPQVENPSGNQLQPVVFGATELSNLSSFTVQLEVGDSRVASWWSDDLSIALVCGSTDCTDRRVAMPL
ncbi:hypothetical protein SEPCBS57363_001091 [Sporothrix epigloea]|uniref:DUF7371 domain-containing protein n=1 Tax=Sporothrix epigloea TaxID=1892477 RepID=A0ABP0D8B3_9PEZI